MVLGGADGGRDGGDGGDGGRDDGGDAAVQVLGVARYELFVC